MKIKYDNQYEKWKECITNKEKKIFSRNWIRKDTLDYWRHQRMLSPIKALISKGDKWLTIGDGRYGTEANFLLECGVKAHASDLNDELLKISKDEGFIDEYSKQNGEELKFPDESFDYVLIKEALHHFPRPWIALSEAFRVCKKGVVLIEPNDQLSSGQNIFKLITFLLKKLKRIRTNIDDYNFEEVGNFIFTLNLREIEKFMLAMHFRNIAHVKINDFYIKGIEEIKTKNISLKNKIISFILKTIINIKNILSILKLSEYSLISVFLMKTAPDKKLKINLKKKNWTLKLLPENPYRK
tara:strand:- start:1387 stop:2280 length:894 start_codon:yes stop_codon:yes gene_type:complete